MRILNDIADTTSLERQQQTKQHFTRRSPWYHPFFSTTNSLFRIYWRWILVWTWSWSGRRIRRVWIYRTCLCVCSWMEVAFCVICKKSTYASTRIPTMGHPNRTKRIPQKKQIIPLSFSVPFFHGLKNLSVLENPIIRGNACVCVCVCVCAYDECRADWRDASVECVSKRVIRD